MLIWDWEMLQKGVEENEGIKRWDEEIISFK
jgi:hypothetical protein